MSAGEILLLAVVLGFAGLVKGVTGFGLQLFATPIIAAVFGVREAVVIMSIPHLALNLLLLYKSRQALAVVRELWSVAIAGVLGVIVGVWLLVRIDQNALALVIAAVVLFSVGGGDRLLGPDPKSLRMRVIGPLFGGFSGLLSGAVSMSGPLLTVYLHAKRLTTREFVASVAAVLVIFSIVQVIELWRVGLYDRAIVTMGLLSLIPSLVALVIGVRVRERLDNASFRVVVSVLLVVAAVNLLVQGLRGLGVLSLSLEPPSPNAAESFDPLQLYEA